jgi:hypothetical protein
VGITGQNWLIVPATPLLPPGESSNQQWQLTLTGVYWLSFQGKTITNQQPSPGEGWASSSELISPDTLTPLNFALQLYRIPIPTAAGTLFPVFNMKGSPAPLVTVDGVFNLVDADIVQYAGAGYVLDPWQAATIDSTDYQGNPVLQFQGVVATIGARNRNTIIRLSYNVTVLGQIAFMSEG